MNTIHKYELMSILSIVLDQGDNKGVWRLGVNLFVIQMFLQKLLS